MVVRRRREHELARHQVDRAVGDGDRRTTICDRRAVDVRDGQAVTIDVRVVAENVDRDRAVFGDREAVVRATGASLTGVTVPETVATAETVPSVIV